MEKFAEPEKKLEPAPEPAPREDVRLEASPTRCPYCHDSVDPQRNDWVACRGCLARHHLPCWGESGVCGTCRGAAFLPAATAPRAKRRGGVGVALATALALVLSSGIALVAVWALARPTAVPAPAPSTLEEALWDRARTHIEAAPIDHRLWSKVSFGTRFEWRTSAPRRSGSAATVETKEVTFMGLDANGASGRCRVTRSSGGQSFFGFRVPLQQLGQAPAGEPAPVTVPAGTFLARRVAQKSGDLTVELWVGADLPVLVRAVASAGAMQVVQELERIETPSSR